MVGLAVLEARDIKELRRAAADEDERFWSEALERSAELLMQAARDIFEGAENSALQPALEAASRDMAVLSAALLFSDALDKLGQLRGTRPILAEAMKRQTESLTHANLDVEDRHVLEEITEGVFERSRLRSLNPARPLDSGDDLVRAVTSNTLLFLALAYALKHAPRSAGAKSIYREALARIHREVERIARILGLGGDLVAKIDAADLVENTEDYEASPAMISGA